MRHSDQIPGPVIERLSTYRRHLRQWLAGGRNRIYSHQLADLEGVTAAQVRRDLMTIGYTGSPARGYDVAGLVQRINDLLDAGRPEGIALVGIGQMGRALLDHFRERHPEHAIVVAFDTDARKVGREVDGCRCHPAAEMEEIVHQRQISVAIIAVPAAAAQDAADRLVRAGVRGLLNLAPVRLRVPAGVHVEDVDIAVSLEKAAFFARANLRGAEVPS